MKYPSAYPRGGVSLRSSCFSIVTFLFGIVLGSKRSLEKTTSPALACPPTRTPPHGIAMHSLGENYKTATPAGVPQKVDPTALPETWKPQNPLPTDEAAAHQQLQVFLERNNKVGGWVFPPAQYVFLTLMRLQLEYGIKGAMGEIGVHHGKLTSFLAYMGRQADYKDRQLFAADLFEGLQKLNIDRSGAGNSVAFNNSLAFVAQTKMEDFVIAIGPSQALTTQYFVNASLQPFRMFSIDGGHTRSTTNSDLALLDQHVADGAIVALDDFLRPTWWGVTEAAVDFDRAKRLVPLCFAGNKIFYTTRSHHTVYAEALRQDEVLSKMGGFGKQQRTDELNSDVQANQLLKLVFGPVDWYRGNLDTTAIIGAAKKLLRYFEE